MPPAGTIAIPFGVKPGPSEPDAGSPFSLMCCEADDPAAIDQFTFTVDMMDPPERNAERIVAEVTRICVKYPSRLGLSTQLVLTADIAQRIGGTTVQQVMVFASQQAAAAQAAAAQAAAEAGDE